jgi:hypothetical protein
MKDGYTFTYKSERSSYDVKISLPYDASLEEVLNAFENFLRASGFYIDMDDYVSIEAGVEMDFEEEEERFDKIMREVDKTFERLSKTSNVISFSKKGENNEDK